MIVWDWHFYSCINFLPLRNLAVVPNCTVSTYQSYQKSPTFSSMLTLFIYFVLVIEVLQIFTPCLDLISTRILIHTKIKSNALKRLPHCVVPYHSHWILSQNWKMSGQVAAAMVLRLSSREHQPSNIFTQKYNKYQMIFTQRNDDGDTMTTGLAQMMLWDAILANHP